jgi:hypothetical protein
MTTPASPGQPAPPAETLCGSCGRFVGALTRCPHCGARVTGRLSVRLFRYAAVLLSTVGLGLLYLMAIKREIPLVQVGKLSPTMNFAFVRVAGTATEDAHVIRDRGSVRSVRFTIDDGTGEIPVTAFAEKGRALVDAGRLPHAGDRVEVTASLNVSADRVTLYLQSADALRLTRAEAPPARLADLDAAQKGKSAVVAGRITRVNAPQPGTKQPWEVGVDDGSAERLLVFWPDVYAKLPEPARLKAGAGVRARVAVGLYRERVQLRIESAADLELAAASPEK